MVYVEELEKNGEKYFYVTKNFRVSEGFKKIRIYFGKNKPSVDDMARAEKEIEASAVSEGLMDEEVTPLGEPWFLIEEISNTNALHGVSTMQQWSDLSNYGLTEGNVLYSLWENTDGKAFIYFPKKRFLESGKAVFQKLVSDPEWGLWLNREITAKSMEYYWYAENLPDKEKLETMSNEELAVLFRELMAKQLASQGAGMPWNTLEFEEQYLTNYLNDRLAKAIEEKHLHGKAQVFSTLTTPTEESFAQNEALSILSIATLVQSDEELLKLFTQNEPSEISKKLSLFPQLNAMVKEHHRNFCWLSFMYEGPEWPIGYFIETLAGLVRQTPEPVHLYQKHLNAFFELKKRQFELTSKLELDEKTRALIEVAKGILYTKGLRKDCLYHAYYLSGPLLNEIARRLNITLTQLRRFMPWEVPVALIEGKANIQLLDERVKHYIQYVADGKTYVLSGRKGTAFMKKLRLEKENVLEAKELKGQCACPGVARGVAKIVNSPKDLWKMQQGDILVSHATNPDLVPAMKKAGAIVTDMGGITCHAAIVSRELRIPCVIGTKLATKTLKDGDVVNVDATHGIIKLL